MQFIDRISIIEWDLIKTQNAALCSDAVIVRRSQKKGFHFFFNFTDYTSKKVEDFFIFFLPSHNILTLEFAN